MGWLDLFRRKAAKGQESPDPGPGANMALTGMRTDIDQLLGRVGTIDIAIKRHNDVLAAHETRLQEYAQRFQTLEQKVSIPVVQPTAFRQAGRHAAENSPRLSTQTAHASLAQQQFDIEQFTEQQKRVLAVFFQNKGIRMSYADVARVLNKSAFTIKNQMNQIRQKVDLFDCTIGNQSRNLFALKADLRVEKYLKVGQPIERPVSMPEADQSKGESEAEKAEPLIEYACERSEPEEEG
jgi:DNA-binding CsgD family transcriptional regulator